MGRDNTKGKIQRTILYHLSWRGMAASLAMAALPAAAAEPDSLAIDTMSYDLGRRHGDGPAQTRQERHRQADLRRGQRRDGTHQEHPRHAPFRAPRDHRRSRKHQHQGIALVQGLSQRSPRPHPLLTKPQGRAQVDPCLTDQEGGGHHRPRQPKKMPRAHNISSTSSCRTTPTWQA